MTDRELMQQALEALESAKYGMAECRQEIGFNFANEQYDVEQAITALRERLAEQDGTCSHCAGAGCVACDARHLPKQEPTWRTPGGIPRFKPKQPEQETPQRTHWEGCEDVHPECRKPEQEPDGIGWIKREGGYFDAPRREPELNLTDKSVRERLAQPEQDVWQWEEIYKDNVLVERRMKRGPDCGWEPWHTPRREWVGLTPFEITMLWKRHTNEDGPYALPYEDDGIAFACAIEAKLKEKNA